jgi:hypothetical protein
MHRLRRCAIPLMLVVLLATACTGGAARTTDSTQPGGSARAGAEQEPGARSEADEEGEALKKRIEAFQDAKRNGTAGVIERVASRPAAGWTGERVVDATKDDWEPAIAADPNGPMCTCSSPGSATRSLAQGTARRRTWHWSARRMRVRHGARRCHCAHVRDRGSTTR